MIIALTLSCFAAQAKLQPSPADSLKIRNLGIKVYIALLNRKPSKTELLSAISRFRLFENKEKGTRELIRTLIADPDFSNGLFDLFRYEYLQGTDYEDINTQISDYKLLLTIKTQSDFADIFKFELDRLIRLRNARAEFFDNKINYNKFQMVFFDNKMFDEINMGDNNFVTATFNYLLSRNPTKYELEEGKKLYNNQYGVLFCKAGTNRSDYLNILFESAAWQEGTIRFWYNKLLNRNPTIEEISDLMKYSKEVSEIIETILLKPEFINR